MINLMLGKTNKVGVIKKYYIIKIDKLYKLKNRKS